MLPSLLTWAFAIQVAVCVTAGLVRGFSGFGAALIMAPGFTLVMPARDAVATTIVLNCLTMGQMLLPAIRLTRWREIGPMGLAGMAGVPFGGLILMAVDGDVMRRVIGALVLGFSSLMLAGWRYRGGRNPAIAVTAGALGGLLTGAAGIGGPPVILYLLSGERPMAESRAGLVSYFALIQLASIPTFAMTGLVDGPLLVRCLLLLVPYLLATMAGVALFHRATETLVRRVALGSLVLIGIATLLR